ncbi:anthranilate synthase component 2/para-aminobenzoate synthetase component 2 [Tumebacillus sp. BK434]|uniref:anthranilate synthase component II n=1 Tax=Tumebacillus sp. BK434 TaxID=2512169 RepID=UPI00104F8A0A|nr:aminodeoxychorismate/anthranilate synthase component II [Tumebacillus sp. BK434]TCP52779.1 anthranilate synthase component 2/para-aminobenzoate synthetase component 2 [Tumebacillus sp. BK434]
MIIVIDNYDSFTYNIVQYLRELGADVLVKRNDEISLEEIERLKPTHLLISPGPCTPNEAGISLAAIRHFAGKIPVLGVCLGHQSIGQVFGGKVVKAQKMMHGKTSRVSHQGAGILDGVPNPFTATRYHSLVVEKLSFPDELEVIAQSEDGEIMALRHRELDVTGLQFHPESILTEGGMRMLQNFVTGRTGVSA